MKFSNISKIVWGFVFLLSSGAVLSQTDFQLTLSPSGNPVTLPAGGGTQMLTYTVTNDINGFDEGDQTTVTFNLDPQIEPANVNSTDTNWSCFPVTSQITCDYFAIYPAGYSSDLVLTITSPINPILVNAAVDADITNAIGDPNPGNDQLITDINFVPAGGVDLSIDKTMTSGFPTTVQPGDSISFDIAVTNLSGLDATNVVVMDDFVVNNLQFDANGSSPDCQDLASFIECTATLIPAGNTVIFTVAATVGISAQPGNYINTATVSANEADPDNSNNSSDQPFTIAIGGFPEVELTKSIFGGATQVVQGAEFEYDIQLNNTGTIDATNVNFVDTLPPEVTYISHSPFGNFSCTYTAPTLSCDAANLPNTTAQDGVRILVAANGPISSNVNNTATTSFADGNSANNTDSAAITIVAPSIDLEVLMDSDLTSYTIGDLINLEVQVHNPIASGGDATNVEVVTTLPNEVVFNSVQVLNAAGWLCAHDGSPAGGDVTCNTSNPVLEGTLTDIQIIAAADAAGTTVTPFATLTSDFDPNPSNDTNNVSFDIFFGDADLSLQFISVPGVYDQGDSIFYEVQVQNPMGSSASPSDVTVDITLPTEVAFSNVNLTNAPGWFCNHDGSPTGGMVNCDRQGNPFVSFSTHDIQVEVIAVTPATAAIVQGIIESVADTNLTDNSASQSDVINAISSDFSIGKTVNVSNATIGDSFTYVLTVSNLPASTGAPVDVVIDDTLPAEVSYDSYVVGTNMGTTINCTHDGSPTGGDFSCDTGTTPFPIGEVVTIDINVTAASANPNVVNTAIVQTSTDPDGTGNNNTASSSAVNISGPLTTTLSVNKDAQVAGVSVTEVNYGQQYDYVLTVTNTGTNDALDVHVSDNLPSEVVLTGFDTTGWTCLPLNANAVNEVVDCTYDTPLAAGNSATILLNVQATNNTAIPSITNQMSSLGSNTGALVMSTNTVNLLNASATLNIVQNPSPIDPGDPVSFDVVFSNTGGSPLNGVQLDAILPPDFTYNSFNGDPGLSCAENAGVVSCTFANPLPAGSSINLSLDLTSPATLNNPQYILQVSGNALELSTPVSSSVNTVFSISDFTVNMFSDPAQVNSGQTFKHVANIANTGSLALNSVEAILAIPSNAQLLAVDSVDMNCSVSGSIVTCLNNQIMMSGDNYLITYTFNSNIQSGLIGTNLVVKADGIDKSASVLTEVGSAGSGNDLSLIKSSSASQVEQRQAFSYLFDIQNNGTSDQSGFTLSDQLPDDVLYQSFSGNLWSCSGETTINCQYNGVLAPGAGTQLQFNVVAPENVGVITNTANLIAEVDDNSSNNQSSVAVEVNSGSGGGAAIADLAIEVTTDSTELLNTEQVSWYISLTNHGPNNASNIEIENMFPVGFNATEVLVDNDVSCVLLNSSLLCTLSSLGVDQTRNIELRGTFNNGFVGMMMNTFEVNAESIDPHTSNNQSHAQIDVIAAENLNADLAVEILADPQEIRQGQTFEMTINTSNNGPDRAYESVLTADIAGLISQVQVVNSGQWVCQSNANSLSCQFPGSYTNALNQSIELNIVTQQVVQTSEPIVVNAMIKSSAMDSNPANNMASLSNGVDRTPTEEEIFSEFEEAIGGGASETVLNTIRNVSSYCARSYFTAIEGLCEEMFASARPENREDIINAMEEMTPNEVIGQSTSAAEIMTSQFRNISSRLSQLRGGGGSGVSVAGLNARYGNESIPLGMLAYLNQSEEEEGQVSNINDFVSPWGFFVNGNISMGERDATGRELGFDFDTYGLTAGVDYRFSPTKVAGVALGYANFDSEIEDEAEMKSTGFTLTGYGSFYIKDNFYVDARISYANPDFEQKRRINFNLDNIAIDRVATGKTNADQYAVAMSMGYHFNKNSWNITPNASFRYARTTIDAFRETGAGDFNFRFGEQEVKSMVWSFGTSISKAISLKNGVLSPQFDINISRETENDGGSVEAWFINAPNDELFLIATDEPDRTYGSAGIGLVFIGANGKQAYINYKSIFGLEGFTRGTINLGARFEF